VGDVVRRLRVVRSFAELGPGQLGLIVDAYGLLAVVADRSSAADALGLQAGAPVVLEPAP